MDEQKIEGWLKKQKHLTGQHDQGLHGNRGSRTIKDEAESIHDNVVRINWLAQRMPASTPSEEQTRELLNIGEDLRTAIKESGIKSLNKSPLADDKMRYGGGGSVHNTTKTILAAMRTNLKMIKEWSNGISQTRFSSQTRDQAASGFAEKIDELAIRMAKVYDGGADE